jgi:tetratricopeptide (TPR) repeat protein
MATFIWTILLLLGLNISNPDARKGNKSYENGDYESAKTWFYSALDQDPNNAEILFNLGNTLTKLGEIEEAIKVFMQAKSYTDDTHLKALADYNIGTVLAENEQWKPAMKHLRASLQKLPSDSEGQLNYEYALMKASEEEDNNEAVKEQADALVNESRYASAFNLMQEALGVDETVRYYESFMNRIGAVNQIEQTDN